MSDLSALAKKYGGIESTDLDALAAKHGGKPSKADMKTTEQSATGDNARRYDSVDVGTKIRNHKQDVQDELGGPVDWEHGLGFTGRAKFSFSNLDSEKEAKLKNMYPNGELRRIKSKNGSNELYFRESPQDDWKPVDPTGPDAGDIADFAGDIPSMVGSAALTPVGGPLIGSMLRAGIGGALGHLAGQGVETVVGEQQDPAINILAQSGLKGLEMAAGQGVGSILSKGGNALVGKGFAARTNPQQDIIDANREMGTYPTRGQVSDNPLFQQAEGYVSRLSSPIGKQRLNQASAVHSFSKGLIKDAGGKTHFEAGRAIRESGRKIIDTAKNEIDSMRSSFSKGVSNIEAGRTAQKGLSEFKTRIGKIGNKLYADLGIAAKKAGEQIKVDISSAKNLYAGRVKGTVTEKGTRYSHKKVMVVPTEDVKLLPVSRKLSPEVGKLISDVNKLDDVQSLDAVRALRSRAWELSQSPLGEPATLSNKEAGKVFAALDSSLDKGVRIKNPEILKMYRRASTYWRAKSQRLADDTIRQMIKTDRPDEVIDTILKGNRVSRLWKIRHSLPRTAWDTFRDAFKGKMASIDPSKIRGAIEAIDPKTRNILLTKKDQANLRNIADRYDDLTSSSVYKLVQKDTEYGKIINDAFKNGKVETASDLIRELGGKDTSGGRAARSGLMDLIISKTVSVDRKTGQAVIDGDKLAAKIQELQSSGIGDVVLTKQDLVGLHKIQIVSARNNSAGAGLAAAGQTSKFIKGDINTKAAALMMFAKLDLIGRLLSSKSGSTFLYGKGGSQVKMPLLENLSRSLSAISGELHHDYAQLKNANKSPKDKNNGN